MQIVRFTILLLILAVMSCSTEEKQQEEVLLTEVNISLDSAKFQRVYDFIDRWQQDSLLPYLDHRDPSFRVMAIRGFAGMMDEPYIDRVGRAILDPIVEVRRMAAYTLGQSRNPQALPHLMRVFENQDSLGIDPMTFKYALEAVGKCADSSYLELLAGITTYRPRDTFLLEGQALGILNLADQGYSGSLATELMVRYATNDTFPASVQLIAANYLDRARGVDLGPFYDKITGAYEVQADPEIRMFLGKAIGKTGSRAAEWVRRILRTEKDDRVRVSLLQGCVAFPMNLRHRIWAGSLRDPHDLVAMTAAELIQNYGSSAYSETYINWAFSNFSPKVYARLLGAGNKYVSNARFHEMIRELIVQRIRSTNDLYLKSDFIRAAGLHPSTAGLTMNWGGEEEAPVILTAVLEALVNRVEETGQVSAHEREYMIRRWKSGDVAALSLLSPLFAEYRGLFSTVSEDQDLWADLSSSVRLPQGLEGRIALDKAREQLFGQTFDPDFYRTTELHTHPINWELYQQLSDKPRMDITTSAGLISVVLFKKAAPATVLNFIELAESGYYDNKPVHRVVPNFVIQGGGNRGDGYGSLEYTIRSEVGPAYYDKSGLMGMASAGLHTESQQWFVTLRPTLHLNGRYTIFGELVDGEEVVRDIRRGDVITSIKTTR